jgi:hypothetical protein
MTIIILASDANIEYESTIGNNDDTYDALWQIQSLFYSINRLLRCYSLWLGCNIRVIVRIASPQSFFFEMFLIGSSFS